MEQQSNLFLTLLELQALIQIYKSHKEIMTYMIKRHKIPVDEIRDYFHYQFMKMDICLVNIKLKKETLEIEESVDYLLEEQIPYIQKLVDCNEYIEFLRTNNLPIEKVYFKIDTKRSCEDAFGKKYCWARNPTQYI